MNRSRSSSPFRKLAAISLMFGMPALVLGCPKKPVPVDIDSGPPPVPTPTQTTTLTPLDDTADADVPDVVEAGKKPSGPGLTQSQSHVKQCCNALRSQAKALGTSPEAAQITSFATMCDGLALQVGPSSGGQAPELAPLRQLLKGKPTIPAVCQGL